MRPFLCCLILLHAGAAHSLDDPGSRSLPGGVRTESVSDPFSVELVWIPAGRVQMGDTSGVGQADEQPLREVAVQGFWMMRTEVTRAMFRRFVEAAKTLEACPLYIDDTPALPIKMPAIHPTMIHINCPAPI